MGICYAGPQSLSFLHVDDKQTGGDQLPDRLKALQKPGGSEAHMQELQYSSNKVNHPPPLTPRHPGQHHAHYT